MSELATAANWLTLIKTVPVADSRIASPEFSRSTFTLLLRSMFSSCLIAPVLLFPRTKVPAVMWSSSASVSPRTPAASAPPSSISVPLVCGRIVTRFAPAFSTPFVAMRIESALIEISAEPVDVRAPSALMYPKMNAALFDPMPPVATMEMSPSTDVTVAPESSMSTP